MLELRDYPLGVLSNLIGTKGKEATDPHGVAVLISSVVASGVASEGSDNDTHFHIRLLLSFPTNSD